MTSRATIHFSRRILLCEEVTLKTSQTYHRISLPQCSIMKKRSQLLYVLRVVTAIIHGVNMSLQSEICNKMWYLMSVGFCSWSTDYNFGFQGSAASNVENYPTIQLTLQLPFSGWRWQLKSLPKWIIFKIWQGSSPKAKVVQNMIVKSILLWKQNFISNSEMKENFEGKWNRVLSRISGLLKRHAVTW
jgi:hypothetical protein